MRWTRAADYVEDHKIHVNFSSGESGTIDFGEVIYSDKRPIFGDLIDIAKFRQFKVDFDTIVWENGLDLAPEFLYNFLVQSQHAT